MGEKSEELISHRREAGSLDVTLAALRRRIIAAGDLPQVSVAEQLALLDQLAAFELGRFLLTNQGLNGFWTHYVVFVHPQRRGLDANAGAALGELERFLLDRAPTFLATQERFTHFRRLVQAEIDRRADEELALASVPCGLMADLLSLDYQACPAVDLAGIDLDDESLRQAAAFATQHGLTVRLVREDAWELSARERFDIVVSNGLNLYEPDDERVTRLYVQLAAALKPGGLLVTSFLTPPSEWNTSHIDGAALARQKVLFSDIIGARWQCFRSEELSCRQLAAVGLIDIQLIPDRANMFPTVVARRPG